MKRVCPSPRAYYSATQPPKRATASRAGPRSLVPKPSGGPLSLWQTPAMRFTLHYRGPLRANGSTAHKYELRRHFHTQLKVLWGQKPLTDQPELLKPRKRLGEYSLPRDPPITRIYPTCSVCGVPQVFPVSSGSGKCPPVDASDLGLRVEVGVLGQTHCPPRCAKPLVGSQGDDRIDARGTPGRKPARTQRD
jgi:hypothetical protein